LHETSVIPNLKQWKETKGEKIASVPREGHNGRYMGNGNSFIVNVGGTQCKVSWELKAK
jgi:hypothetical protein